MLGILQLTPGGHWLTWEAMVFVALRHVRKALRTGIASSSKGKAATGPCVT